MVPVSLPEGLFFLESSHYFEFSSSNGLCNNRYRVSIRREILYHRAPMYSSMSLKLSFIHPQIKTPTLLLLGADDLRVPPKQGTNFHRLLKAKGVETRLVRNGMYRSVMARTKSEKKPNQIDDFRNSRGGFLLRYSVAHE